MNQSAAFCTALGIEVPLICGAMYPCSNPELVAAVSAAGGIGVVQPLSLTCTGNCHSLIAYISIR